MLNKKSFQKITATMLMMLLCEHSVHASESVQLYIPLSMATQTPIPRQINSDYYSRENMLSSIDDANESTEHFSDEEEVNENSKLSLAELVGRINNHRRTLLEIRRMITERFATADFFDIYRQLNTFIYTELRIDVEDLYFLRGEFSDEIDRISESIVFFQDALDEYTETRFASWVVDIMGKRSVMESNRSDVGEERRSMAIEKLKNLYGELIPFVDRYLSIYDGIINIISKEQ